MSRRIDRHPQKVAGGQNVTNDCLSPMSLLIFLHICPFNFSSYFLSFFYRRGDISRILSSDEYFETFPFGYNVIQLIDFLQIRFSGYFLEPGSGSVKRTSFYFHYPQLSLILFYKLHLGSGSGEEEKNYRGFK